MSPEGGRYNLSGSRRLGSDREAAHPAPLLCGALHAASMRAAAETAGPAIKSCSLLGGLPAGVSIARTSLPRPICAKVCTHSRRHNGRDDIRAVSITVHAGLAGRL
jgi:hypothetical protein